MLKIIILLISTQNIFTIKSVRNLQNSSSNSYSNNVPCTATSLCNFGICNNSTLFCECQNGYLNFFQSNSSNISPCLYEQKEQYNAFLLELLIGFGSGQFYLNRRQHGVLKLIAYLFGIASIYLFPFSLSKVYMPRCSKLRVFFLSLFYCFFAIFFAVLYIYDLVMIRNNNYLDGNGYPLLAWGD